MLLKIKSAGQELTHLGGETHIHVSKLTIIVSDNGLAPGRNNVNSDFRNKLKWNLKRNSSIFNQENAFENIVYEMAAIQCVEGYDVSFAVFIADDPVPAFPKRKYVISQSFVSKVSKPHLPGASVALCTDFQNDWTTLNVYLAATRLGEILPLWIHCVYIIPNKKAHGFVVPYFVVILWVSGRFIWSSNSSSKAATLTLGNCIIDQKRVPLKDMGKNDQCQTTWKKENIRTMGMFFGCRVYLHTTNVC